MSTIFFTSMARPSQVNKRMRSASKAPLSWRIKRMSFCSFGVTKSLQPSMDHTMSSLNSKAGPSLSQAKFLSSDAAPKLWRLMITFRLKRFKVLSMKTIFAQLSSTRRLAKGLYYSKIVGTSTRKLRCIWSKTIYFRQSTIPQWLNLTRAQLRSQKIVLFYRSTREDK